MTRRWDIGDPEPKDVDVVHDEIAAIPREYDGDDAEWHRTVSGDEWKGYKDGYKRYLSWDELVRRWGPVIEGPAGR